VKHQLDRALKSAPRLKAMIKTKQVMDAPWRALKGAWKRVNDKLS